jgi:alkaline phosphatase D
MLGGSAAALLLAACGADSDGATALGLTLDGIDDDPETVPTAPLTRFPLGVASGDVSTRGAVLWTRYGGTAALFAAVWEMDGDDYVDRVALVPVTPASGGFVHVDVPDLTPGARHRYAFFELVNGQAVARSPIGRFRAAVADDAIEALTFGATACTSNGWSHATLERAGARSDLDLFCLLGDTTYNDGSRSRDDFRGRWAQNLSTAGYRSMRQSVSVLPTWDDHEITNNWNPETIDETTLVTGAAAFFEHLPIRRHAAESSRVYRSVRWGLTAEFFVLDSRSERRPSTRSTANAQYLSRAQMTWLKEGLADSPAVFKVILNSVPITDFPGLFELSSSDRWEGYPAARREILSFIADQRVDGVLWVAGDFHLGSAGRLARSGLGSDAIEVLAGPGGQFPNPLVATLWGNPQFDVATGASNYTAVALDPETRGARVTFHDGRGQTIADRSYVL